MFTMALFAPSRFLTGGERLPAPSAQTTPTQHADDTGRDGIATHWSKPPQFPTARAEYAVLMPSWLRPVESTATKAPEGAYAYDGLLLMLAISIFGRRIFRDGSRCFYAAILPESWHDDGQPFVHCRAAIMLLPRLARGQDSFIRCTRRQAHAAASRAAATGSISPRQRRRHLVSAYGHRPTPRRLPRHAKRCS